MTLKEKLLSLNIFEDNEYLDKYVELIESNRDTKREKFKTQRHHIIPRYYYRQNNLEIDNSKDNLVNLLYKDHFISHILLAKCSIKEIDVYNNFIALSYMGKHFKYYDLDCLQQEYEECRKKCIVNNPMYNKVYKEIHDDSMRSEKVRTKISSTMKKKIANGEFFTPKHRENLVKSLKDSVYMYNDEKITRVRTSDIEEYLQNGWKIYEKRTYSQLCGKEIMTVKRNNFKMFASRCVSCYCILETGEKFEFKSIREACIWWFENYHPFGNHYAECVLQRKIKQSIETGRIIYGTKGTKKYCEITNIKWYK